MSCHWMPSMYCRGMVSGFEFEVVGDWEYFVVGNYKNRIIVKIHIISQNYEQITKLLWKYTSTAYLLVLHVYSNNYEIRYVYFYNSFPISNNTMPGPYNSIYDPYISFDRTGVLMYICIYQRHL